MGEIKLSREYAERGYTADELKRMARAGDVRRVRRGAYVEGPTATDERISHRRLVEATLRQTSVDAAVSHMSAAALHGLPVWRDQLTRAQLTRDRSGGSKSRRYVHLHGVPLPPSDVTVLDGLAVTTLARTVVDLGCQLSLERAVAVGDAALRLGLEAAELEAVLARSRRRQGIGAARRAAALLDGRSESPEESRSRVVFHRHALPAPQPQFTVLDVFGVFVAR